MRANPKIREMLREKKIPYWRLGEELGVSEQTVLRWMRTPLCDWKLDAINKAISRICSGGESDV